MMSEVIRYGILGIVLLSAGIVWVVNRKLENGAKAVSKAEKIYLPGGLPMCLIAAIYVCIRYTPFPDLFLPWRLFVLLPVLWLIAFVDYKKNLILNAYLLLLIVMRAALLLPEFAIEGKDAGSMLLTELLCSLILFGVGILLRLLSKNGLGMGDIKLFMVLPLYFGSANVFRALFWAMVALFFVAVFCLITKRKEKKDVLPFAPAVLAGSYLVTFLIYL